ncbi:MAG: NADH-quinone oxidoreductase subunit L [Isosphaeraceae bacterium]
MSHWQGWLYLAALLIPLVAFAVERLAGRWLGDRNAAVAIGAIGTSFLLSLVGFVLYLIASGGMPSEGHGEADLADEASVAAGASQPGEASDMVASFQQVQPGLGGDLNAFRTDPGGTAKAWLRGQRRQAWTDSSLVWTNGDGSPMRLQAANILVESPMFSPGGGGVTTSAITIEATGDGKLRPEPSASRIPKSQSGPVAWTGSIDWVSLGGGTAPPLKIPAGIRIDGLAAMMFLMVTFVATLVHIYAGEYMRGDPHYPRFFAYLSLFCFSMLGLIAASSLFWVFVFWELVGICSYLLIGFWSDKKSNSDAANKAFVTNRIGDVGMLVGLGIVWAYLGTFDLADLNRTLRDPSGNLNIVAPDGGPTQVERREIEPDGTLAPLIDPASKRPFRIPMALLTLAGLGVFAGCMGKSAQFPLHVWLPDAMAGPTPVSALIHAATMVAAGVYLVGRIYGLFTADVLLAIAYIGGITLILGASIAMAQVDYKKVLAYSTVSQLGFMMLGLGVGGWSAGLFHLLTHAGFKALLFLGAGSVHHAVHTYEMTHLGGLYPRMKVTARTMLLATMAISGVPLLSGFYSKDAVLAAAFAFAGRHPEHMLLLVLPVVGSLLTAFYMFRMWFLIFTGPDRGGHAQHAHESPRPMLVALLALSVPTVAVGWPWLIAPLTGEPVVEGWLLYSRPIPVASFASEHLRAFGASMVVASLGIGLGLVCYGPLLSLRRIRPDRVATRIRPIHQLLVHKYYLDELFALALVRPILGLSRLVSVFDRVVIDGFINGLARGVVKISTAEGLLDRLGVDGLVNLVGRTCYAFGDRIRWLQAGRLRGYLTFLGAAVVLICLGLFAWVRS